MPAAYRQPASCGARRLPGPTTANTPAAQTFAAIALLPGVLNAPLVYAYPAPDAPSAASSDAFDTRYPSWLTTLCPMAQAQAPTHPNAPSLRALTTASNPRSFLKSLGL